MIRRSTLVLLTCLGALSVSALPSKSTIPVSNASVSSGSSLTSLQSASVLLSQAEIEPTDEGAASNVLSIGSRGRAVRALQNRLQETGYYDGSVDGIYGLGTQRAVLAFQEDQGFEPTGRLDDPTWEALEAYDGSSASSSSDAADSPDDSLITRTDTDASSAEGNEESPQLSAQDTETAPVAAPAENSGGGFGRLFGLGLGLLAVAASFGVGFFIANKSKLEASEEASGDDWGEIDPQLGVPANAPLNGGGGFSGATAQNQDSGANSFAGTSVNTSGAALTPVPAPVSAGGLSSSGQMGGTSALAPTDIVDGLIKDLHNPDPSQRRKVIWELGQRGNSIAVQPLVDAMVSADSKEKSLVLAALSEIGIRSLKPMNRALAIALKDDNPEVRKNAIRDLTRIYDLVIQISQMLGHATEDEDPEVRQTATWALDQLNRLRRTQDIDNNMRSFNSGSGPNRFAS